MELECPPSLPPSPITFERVMKFYEPCSQLDQVQLPSSVIEGFSKIDAKAYLRRCMIKILGGGGGVVDGDGVAVKDV